MALTPRQKLLVEMAQAASIGNLDRFADELLAYRAGDWARKAMEWRRKYAELRYPGMTNEVHAHDVPERETTDNWRQYAREGETAQVCIERHRREQDSLLKLLAQAREPLTDQQIISLVPAGWTGMLAQVMEFARRIERARTDGVKTGEGSSND